MQTGGEMQTGGLSSSGQALERLIQAVRERRIRDLVLDQSARAATLALAGAAVLLVTGTQILHWFWPMALFGGALAYGLWRIQGRIPGHYAVAQQIDRDLALDDALSTAWHFNTGDIGNSSEDVRRAQHAQAERRAQAIDPRQASPFALPRSMRLCAVMGVVALTLFGIRYGVQKSLDLARPLVAFDINPFSGGPVRDLPAKKGSKAVDDYLKSVSIEPPESKEDGLDAAPDSALGTVEVPDVDNSNSERPSAATKEKADGAQEGGENPEGTEGVEGASSGDDKGAPSDKGSTKDGKESKSGNQQTQQPGENSSMLDKMKDALANLMNKLNVPQNKQGQSEQKQSAQKGGQQSANARQQQQKGGQQTKGQQSQESQQSNQQAQGDQDMQDPSEASQGKPGDRNSEQASSSQNKSGMGKQDGEKDVKLAEQAAAMGKISEIIGKRNEKLQGEVMIEVNSSRQALRTQYTNRTAAHGESGSEIHRDEVPLMYQHFVQQYFDEVRKPAPAAAKPAAPAAPGKSSR